MYWDGGTQNWLAEDAADRRTYVIGRDVVWENNPEQMGNSL